MVPNDIVYMDFNVWQHSGDLTTSFLREFSVFLEINKIATQSISQKFEQYIEKVSDMHPVVRSFSRLIERKYTTQEIFSDISQLIIDSKKRIVIFIDDVDRLGDWNQWNQLFSILRATANFSNVFYVVCFSKKELQKIFPAHFKDALTQDVDVYIEKIFNLKYNLDF
jgi:predicted KAP-like P-loop ATPase